MPVVPAHPSAFQHLEQQVQNRADKAQAVLADAYSKGLPLKNMAISLLCSIVVLFVNFISPQSSQLYGDSGLITVDCTQSNPGWERHRLLSQCLGCFSLLLIGVAWMLGSFVVGLWPCKIGTTYNIHTRRRIFLAWVTAMLISFLVLCAFQFTQSKSTVVAALRKSSRDGCVGAETYIENVWQYSVVSVVAIAVSEYMQGLLISVKHIRDSKADAAELSAALHELKNDLAALRIEAAQKVIPSLTIPSSLKCLSGGDDDDTRVFSEGNPDHERDGVCLAPCIGGSCGPARASTFPVKVGKPGQHHLF